jgi:hypothetical protein
MFQMLHSLQTFVSFKYFSCVQVFCVSEVCSENHGAQPERRGKDMANRGPADGARDVPRVLRMGRARPYLGSRLVLHHVGK